MEKRVEVFQHKTIYQLIQVIKDVWKNLSFTIINGLIDDIPDILKKVNTNPIH